MRAPPLALTSAGARTLAELAAARRALTAYSALMAPPATTRLPTRGFYASRAGAGLILEKPWEIANISRAHRRTGPAIQLNYTISGAEFAAWAQPNAARDMVRHLRELSVCAPSSGVLSGCRFPLPRIIRYLIGLGPWIFPNGLSNSPSGTNSTSDGILARHPVDCRRLP